MFETALERDLSPVLTQAFKVGSDVNFEYPTTPLLHVIGNWKGKGMDGTWKLLSEIVSYIGINLNGKKRKADGLDDDAQLSVSGAAAVGKGVKWADCISRRVYEMSKSAVARLSMCIRDKTPVPLPTFW